MKDIIDAKTRDPSFIIDEEMYELLKKLTKCKELSDKYREKAQ